MRVLVKIKNVIENSDRKEINVPKNINFVFLFIVSTSVRNEEKPNSKPPTIDIKPNDIFIVNNHIPAIKNTEANIVLNNTLTAILIDLLFLDFSPFFSFTLIQQSAPIALN